MVVSLFRRYGERSAGRAEQSDDRYPRSRQIPDAIPRVMALDMVSADHYYDLKHRNSAGYYISDLACIRMWLKYIAYLAMISKLVFLRIDRRIFLGYRRFWFMITGSIPDI